MIHDSSYMRMLTYSGFCSQRVLYLMDERPTKSQDQRLERHRAEGASRLVR